MVSVGGLFPLIEVNAAAQRLLILGYSIHQGNGVEWRPCLNPGIAPPWLR